MQYSLPPNAFTKLQPTCKQFISRQLFYPSSGNDTETPMLAFLPFIDVFWFVDPRYSSNRPLFDESTLGLVSEIRDDRRLDGLTIRKSQRFSVDVIQTVYRHIATGRRITVNMCCGRGYDTLRTALRTPGELKTPISIFFYRGDSPGESGSGFNWLRKPVLKHVLEHIEPNGLLVSDGSNAIRNLARFHRNNDVLEQAVAECVSFEKYGRTLKCIAYLGERYGPTLAWQVS
jgi:hypothetical protein